MGRKFRIETLSSTRQNLECKDTEKNHKCIHETVTNTIDMTKFTGKRR